MWGGPKGQIKFGSFRISQPTVSREQSWDFTVFVHAARDVLFCWGL